LASAEKNHGSKAKQFEDAQNKLQTCKDVLSALDRGLVIGEEGEAVSLLEQILDLKKKYDQEERKALRFKTK
jgi:hypothetical protein